MKFSKENLSANHKIVLSLLFIVPLLIMLSKWSVLPTSSFFSQLFSFADLSKSMQTRVAYTLFIPFGATVAVFFRLVLGIRLFGPFRSILIAIAFKIMGIQLGLIFLVVVITIVVLIRPIFKALNLPYFARVSVLLSVVALIMLFALNISTWFDFKPLSRVVYFPIIALCLTCESFARTLSIEGMRSALWRAAMTVIVGILITLIAQINGFWNLFLHFPELLIVQIAFNVIIAEFFDLRLLARLNPSPQQISSADQAVKVSSDVKKASGQSTLRNCVRPELAKVLNPDFSSAL
jgi:hypothetical protein